MQKDHQSGSNNVTHNTSLSHKELWKWTLTPAAVAACRLLDIFEMTECEGAKSSVDPEYFWLGRVPCRSVSFIGLVTGVQAYENRTVYHVDDGSATIDCNLRHTIQQEILNRDPLQKKNVSSGVARAPHALGPKAPPPKPLAAVGDIIRVVGRVLNRNHTRIVNVAELGVCKDANQELRHWLRVAELHEKWYHAPNLGPFTIPDSHTATTTPSPRISTATPIESEISTTVTRAQTQSPARSVTTAISSAPSSPSSVASTSTSHKPDEPKIPTRLRHPSRLHTRDLTANTFRIYLKHYMDNCPTTMVESDDEEDIENVHLDIPQTPTKRPSYEQRHSDMTPRPLGGNARPEKRELKTPRPSKQPARADDSLTSYEDALRGFTLSHLRRVPELSLLARKVVDAEAKRRAREERKKQRELEASKSSHRSSTSKATHGPRKSSEPREAKVKRLFTFAIRQLYEEGSIVLWDGPVRPLPPKHPYSQSVSDTQLSSTLWKINSSMSTTGDSTVFSTATKVDVDDEDGTLSDPQPDEEAYIPLSPSYLGSILRNTIPDVLVSRRRATAAKLNSDRTNHSGVDIARTLSRVEGPTAKELTEYMKRSDERWRRLGEWAVKEALQLLLAHGLAWTTHEGRWDVYS